MTLRGDNDFDPAEPHYNDSGQTVGGFATICSPQFTAHMGNSLAIFYDADLALYHWSAADPAQAAALGGDVFVARHRQLYLDGAGLDGRLGFRVGFQRFADPTGLMIHHWLGLASASWRIGDDVRLTGFVGQMPDRTWEGVVLDGNNFNRDIFVYGVRADVGKADGGGAAGADGYKAANGAGANADSRGSTLSAAVHAIEDRHEMGRRLWLIAPNLHLAGGLGPTSYGLHGSLDAVIQVGGQEGGQLGGGAADIFAWAAQASLGATRGALAWRLNLLALSADDSHDGNDFDGAFRGAAKNSSATRLLTEDENRDWFDNLDERMSAFRGGFFALRAGLALSDLALSWQASPGLRAQLIVGSAFVLEKANALGETYVGSEVQVGVDLRHDEALGGLISAGVVLPGAAGAALVNRLDLGATEPIWMATASLTARF